MAGAASEQAPRGYLGSAYRPRAPKLPRITYFCAERFWRLDAEMEVTCVAEFQRMIQGDCQSRENMNEIENVMKGYHDFIENAPREIYKIEG